MTGTMSINPKDIHFKYNVKEFFGFMKPYKILIGGVILFSLLSELIDIGVRFLYKILIDNGTEFIAGNISYDAVISIFIIIAIAFGAFKIGKTFNNWFWEAAVIKLESNMIFDLKRKYFNHIIHLSHDFHTSHKTGSLISRVIRGGSATERMSDVLVWFGVPVLFQIIVAAVSIAYFSTIPVMIILLTSLCFVGYAFFIQHLQKKPNVELNNKEDIEKANISDIFTNIDSIKYFGKEKQIKRRYFKISDITRRALVRNWNYHRWFSSGQVLILSAGVFSVMYYCVMQFLAGSMTLGTLVFIYTTFGALIPSLFRLTHGIRQFYRAMAEFEALFQYGKIENDIKDKPLADNLKVHNGKIEFRDIKFGYKRKKLFDKFNLKINPNEKVALVGPSGCGKTTLIKLLYRLYDPIHGQILIDGKDIRDFKQESVREELSIVPQECILFDDTIYNNIRFSNPKATRDEVFKAIKFANLNEFIEELPERENTIVGERGVKLSGGEKQRVSIARAILANKKILVLDEATSSLDSETEHEIQMALKKLMKGRTSIIIAHRLSTIMSADKIVVIEKGKIVQMGTHQQLIKSPGRYKKLWDLQKGGYLEMK